MFIMNNMHSLKRLTNKLISGKNINFDIPKLTRQELITGKKIGYYIVEKTPLMGYKIVFYDYKRFIDGVICEGSARTIVRIHPGATIIRPYNIFGKLASDSLRTDELEVIDIRGPHPFFSSWSKIRFYSTTPDKYPYINGYFHYCEEDMDISSGDNVSGLYFLLNSTSSE